MLGQDLDGYRAIKTSVAGAINLAHAARTDSLEDFVWAELVACGQDHVF